MSGSGLPVRYSDTDGTVLPLYQQPTQVDDHPLLPERFGYRTDDVSGILDKLANISITAERYRGPIVLNHHPHQWITTDAALQEGLLEYASERNAAIWGASRWLDFVESRRASALFTDGRAVRGWIAGPEQSLLVEGLESDDKITNEKGDPVTQEEIRLLGVDYRLVKLAPGAVSLEFQKRSVR
jgi:hypothetical protein